MGSALAEPSGRVTVAANPTEEAGVKASSVSPTFKVSGSAWAAATRSSAWTSGKKLGSTGQSVQVVLNELVKTTARPRKRVHSTTAASGFPGSAAGPAAGLP